VAVLRAVRARPAHGAREAAGPGAAPQLWVGKFIAVCIRDAAITHWDVTTLCACILASG
jgi:hypothetical protein